MEYKKYDDITVEGIFSSLELMDDAAWYLLENYEKSDIFNDITGNMLSLTANSQFAALKLLGKNHCLFKTLENIKATVTRMINGEYSDRMQMKIQFELAPLIEEAYLYTKYYLWAVTSPERMQQYKNEIPKLCANKYILEYEKTGEYPYEIAFTITGYNKLKYTKLCVESLLRNIPRGLKYQLILINHGSSDGTLEYFKTIDPAIQIDLKVNGGGRCCFARFLKAKYVMNISNDIIIGTNSIQNMIACFKSDPQIAYVVPTTPAISNLQTIPADYTDLNGFEEFTRKNNISDPYRWEQRTRLVDPISMYNAALLYGKNGVFDTGLFLGEEVYAFPDDRMAMIYRHLGYKMFLAKDAYCHHFGSITIGEELKKNNDTQIYDRGRKQFEDLYGFDPWGTGFCFPMPFLNRLVGNDENHHIDVLGINCGQGSASLKIKEQIKEYCHNTDVTLVNITDEERYVAELRGTSDDVQLIVKFDDFENFMNEHRFSYVVWDDPFLRTKNQDEMMKIIFKSLSDTGKLIIHKSQDKNAINNVGYQIEEIGNGWYVISKVIKHLD